MITQRVSPQPSCVAGFKHALFLLPALIAAIFAFSASAASSASAAPRKERGVPYRSRRHISFPVAAAVYYLEITE